MIGFRRSSTGEHRGRDDRNTTVGILTCSVEVLPPSRVALNVPHFISGIGSCKNVPVERRAMLGTEQVPLAVSVAKKLIVPQMRTVR